MKKKNSPGALIARLDAAEARRRRADETAAVCRGLDTRAVIRDRMEMSRVRERLLAHPPVEFFHPRTGEWRGRPEVLVEAGQAAKPRAGWLEEWPTGLCDGYYIEVQDGPGRPFWLRV